MEDPIQASNGRRLHVQHTYSPGTSLLLDPTRGEEKLRENSGSTTAWWWSLWYSSRASPSATGGGRGVTGGRGRRQGHGCGCPPPSIYRVPKGGRPWRSNLPRGRRPRGVECPPRQVGRPPPSGIGGPTRWTPWTLPVVPVQYRVTPKLSRWPKQHFLYIILYHRTIPELLVTSEISSGTPNNFRISAYIYLYNPSITEP